MLAALVAPRMVIDFTSVREKVVRSPIHASGPILTVPVPAGTPAAALVPPFATISHIRNGSDLPLSIRLSVDGREICAASIGARSTQRVDCAFRGVWDGGAVHTVAIAAGAPGFALEYLELATHYGALTTGARDLIVVPRGAAVSHKAPFYASGWIFALLTLAISSIGMRLTSNALRVVHLACVLIAGCVLGAVILSRVASQYELLVSPGFLTKLLLPAAAPRLVRMLLPIIDVVRRRRESVAWRAVGPVAVGLFVIGVFWSAAKYRVEQFYGGNVSGLLIIARHTFDDNPMLRDRPDIRRSLYLDDDGGYDAQWAYYIAYDPSLSTFRHEPRRYRAFIDVPPYRYGRIGYSLLTKVFSGDRPLRYPATMVALVIASLGACGALLGEIARRNGRPWWYGAMVVAIPGVWQSMETSLPEPLAAAFLLAGYLCSSFRPVWAAGALFAMSLLVRETGAAFVLILLTWAFLAGRRRAALVTAVVAFLPLAIWRGFVGWVLWPDWGLQGFLFHPPDFDVPLAGMRHVWADIAHGAYFDGSWGMARSGIAFSVMILAGAALALALAVRRPGPVSLAAAFYASLAVSFNFEAVWLAMGNAHRVTIDLFLCLALAFAQPRSSPRLLSGALALFWIASTWYVFFGTFESALIRDSVWP